MMKFKEPRFPNVKSKLPLKGAIKAMKVKPFRRGEFELEDD